MVVVVVVAGCGVGVGVSGGNCRMVEMGSSPRPAFCSVGEITSGSDRGSGDCVGGRCRSGGCGGDQS